ncbi:MAG: hypothetical protein KDJ47_06145 [Hyphomicrobiaceae bacterium]|nr:hypothetical protein [Hyphomicrobiaceae bacterium]
MLKFIFGVVFGALMSFLYVHYNIQLPSYLQVPELLRGNLVSTATDATLYDLGAAKDARQRALEVYFDNRSGDAARIDAEYGYPFLTSLHRERASRQARQLLMAREGFDMTLAKDALRTVLEKKHGTSDTVALRRAMLMDALDRKPFLKRWLQKTGATLAPDNLTDILKGAAAYPALLADGE